MRAVGNFGIWFLGVDAPEINFRLPGETKFTGQKVGVLDAHAPLRLEPFEVRFMARRCPPSRWVIDLSKNDKILIKPQEYHAIPNVEDRLFVPEEYVPLFVEAGWKRQA